MECRHAVWEMRLVVGDTYTQWLASLSLETRVPLLGLNRVPSLLCLQLHFTVIVTKQIIIKIEEAVFLSFCINKVSVGAADGPSRLDNSPTLPLMTKSVGPLPRADVGIS